MAKDVKTMRNLFVAMIICFFVSFYSLSVLMLVPVVEGNGRLVLQYTVAILFWTGLVAGIILTFVIHSVAKKVNKRLLEDDILIMQILPGVFTFSGKKKHLLLYLFLVIGIVMMISDIIWNWVSSYLMFPIISVTLFLFVVHSVIDGVDYKIYKSAKEGEKDGHKN